MNTQKHLRRPFAALVAAAVVLFAVGAMAQPGDDTGPWTKLDLTKEQQAKVREIVKEHREASRDELHKKLSAVLSEEQLEQLEKMDGNRRGPFAKRMERAGRGGRGPGMRGKAMRGGTCCDRRGGHHGHHARCGGGSEMSGPRGDRGMRGPGPHMGEMREEGGKRMVERLRIALDLTDEQHEKVAAIVKEHQGQFAEFDRSEMSWEERQKTRDAHRMLLANRIKEVLTDDQRETYEEWLENMPEPRRHGRRGR